jgi:two-component system, NtrC family, sensor histidine kinase HydH
MVLVSIALAAGVTVGLLREGSSAQMASTSKGLEGELDEIVGAYHEIRQAAQSTGAWGATLSANETALRHVMTEALDDDPGMSGGFFDPAGRLIGYAFPTSQGSDRSQPSARTKEAAERVAREAVSRKTDADATVDFEGKATVFRARALQSGPSVEGVVWVSEPVPRVGVLKGNTLRASFLALLGLSILTTALAWRFSHRLDQAVRTIEETLSAKESRPDGPVPSTRFREIDRIGNGIDHLARSLEAQRQEREDLEGRLHRADRLASLGKLVAGVAHEVRNPLASIKLKLHLLRLDRDPRKAEAAFSVIQEEITRLDRMVARLLTISKVATTDFGALQDLAEVVESRSEFWSGRAAESGVELTIRVAREARGAVSVDADAVVPIVDNLLSNALEALGDARGAIDVALERREGPEVAMIVTDTGPGVDPEVVQRLFEPFFTTRTGGTGLGLFLSAEMARRLGGEIRYTRAAPEGARFELRVPC